MDDHLAFKQQLFDVTMVELKPEIPTHGATDDHRWKAMIVTNPIWISLSHPSYAMAE
jgi:hypothetical protein